LSENVFANSNFSSKRLLTYASIVYCRVQSTAARWNGRFNKTQLGGALSANDWKGQCHGRRKRGGGCMQGIWHSQLFMWGILISIYLP